MKHGIYKIAVEGVTYFEVYYLSGYEGMFATLADAELCFSREVSNANN